MYLTTLRNENKYSISLLSIKILLSKQNFCHCWKNSFLWNLNTSSKTQIEPIQEGTKHSVFGCELHTNVEQMCVYCYCCSQSSPAVKIYLNLITRSYYCIQYHGALTEFLAISALKLNSKLKNFGTYGMEISLTQEFNIKCIRSLKLAGTDLVWGSNEIKQNLKLNLNVLGYYFVFISSKSVQYISLQFNLLIYKVYSVNND